MPLTVLEAGKSMSEVPADLVLVRVLFLVCRWLSFGCSLTWLRVIERDRET